MLISLAVGSFLDGCCLRFDDVYANASIASGKPINWRKILGRDFNLLPYYISMFKPGQGYHGERIGLKIAVQDCGSWLRVFVPPEGGINGSGDTLSCLRVIMHFGEDGAVSIADLIDRPLVRLYLHTMTNGVLVGGDNSKMSILEKLARLTLEN